MCSEPGVGGPERAVQLRAAILQLLAQRADGATICPSEAAREVAATQFRDLMPVTREVARDLVDEGMIVITQRGEIVDPDRATGPVRLRLR